MEDFAKQLSHYSGWVLLILLGLVLVLCVILAKLWIDLNRTRKKFAEILNSGSSQNVEEMLLSHLKERQELRNQLETMDDRVVTLERKLQRSKRHLGLVRYDAFPDIGGNQSFTLAVYDDNGDGAILSSIIGRADNKVYGKTLTNGKTGHTLTEEEEQAIFEAVKGSNKGSEPA